MKHKPGTVDHSSKYCENLLALFTTRCVLSPEIHGFQVFSYLEGFGNLDDIIINVEYTDGSKKAFVFQLKHKSTRRLNKDMLLNPKGDFSLIKYQNSYEEILENKRELTSILRDVQDDDINLIIFTNMLFVSSDNEIIKTKTVETDKYNYFINTSKKTKAKVFKVENGSKQLFHSEFLSQLLLFTSQLNADEIENAIAQDLSEEFKDIKKESVLTYIQYVSDWMYGKLGKHYPLSYKEIEMKLLEIIIQPWIILPDITKTGLEHERQWMIWNKAMITSDITLLHKNKSIDYVCKAVLELLKSSHVWNLYTNDRIFDDPSTNSRIVKKVIIKRKRLKGDLNSDHIYMTLWELKQLPLILHCITQESVCAILKALKLFSRSIRKFIIVSECMISDNIKEVRKIYRIFNDVTSLSVKLASNILGSIQVTLQSKESICLKDLLSEEISDASFLTADKLLEMCTITVNIGEKCSLESFHITRNLCKCLLTENVISAQGLDIFILYAKSKFISHITKTLRTETYMDFEQYVTNANFIDKNVCIITLNQDQQETISVDLVKRVHNVNPNIPTHLLEYLPDLGVYKWMASIGNVTNLKNYMVEDCRGDVYHINETEAFSYFLNSIQLMCGPPGSGKTETLKCISNSIASNIWSVYIDLLMAEENLKKLNSTSDNVELLLNLINASGDNTFSNELFKIMLKKGKVAFFLDNVDCIEENSKTREFLDLVIKLCLNYGDRLLMTSRCNLKEKLIEDYNSLPIKLEGLSEDQICQLLNNALDSRYPPKVYRDIVCKITNVFGTYLSGLMHQWNIVLEILKDKDLKSFVEKDDVTIDLFKESVNLNFNCYSMNRESNYILMYKMGLSVVFEDTILRDIIDFDEFLRLKKAFIAETKNTCRLFIITGFDDGEEPEFIDNKYVDFIVAHWLTQNIKRDTIKKLTHKLFYAELSGAKKFFDTMLADGLSLHLAIMNSQFDIVKKIFGNDIGNEDKLLSEVDICGRTALHLSASIGKYFDFQTVSQISGIKNVCKHCEAFKFDIYTDLSIPETEDLSHGLGGKIFSFLVQKAAKVNSKVFSKRDDMGLTVYDHCYRSGRLENLNELLNYGYYSRLSENQNVFFLRHCYQNDLFNVLGNSSFECFCSVRIGRKLMVDEIDKEKVVFGSIQKCCDVKLIVKVNRLEYSDVQEDSPNMDDTKNINMKFLEVSNDWDGDFHRAARDCNYNKLQNMISKRLDDEIINTLSPASFTALHTLVCSARYINNIENFIKCAELLIDNGVDINHPDIHNQSVILHAAVRRYKQFVNFLIKKCWEYIDLDNYKQCGGESARKVILKHNLFDGRLPEEKHIYDTKKLILSSIKGNNEIEFCSLIEQKDIVKYINSGDGKNDDISAYTMLQLCLVKNLQSFAKRLIEVGADCFKTIQKNKEKPVESAVKKHNYELVKLIFEKYQIKDRISSDLLNHQDVIGRTLLHEATYKCHFDFILKLIEGGSSLFIEDCQGKIPLDTIHKSILSEHLDECIDYDSDNDPESITIEYKTLIDNTSRKRKAGSNNRLSYSNLESLVDDLDQREVDEVKILSAIRRTSGIQDLLSHPVIRTLIDLKLNQMIWIYHINLIVYALFWLFLHLNTLQQGFFIFFILCVLTIVLTVRELFQFYICCERIMYFLQVENVIEMILLIFTFAVLYVDVNNEENPTVKYRWLYISALLFSTIDLLFLVGKNYFVHSIMTYRYILAKFMKYIAPFSLLFITFTLAFHVLLQDHRDQSTGVLPYDLFVRLFTSILMFSGEIKEEYLYQGVNVIFGRITVVLFVFIMSTVLANMLLTLLVNDMDEMRHSALIKQYSEKTKYILQVEAFIKNIHRKPMSCFSKLFFLLLGNRYLCRRFQFDLFGDNSQIEILLRSEKRLNRGTIHRFKKKVSALIEINRTGEHQKIRDLKRLIDKIVSSPDFVYRDVDL